MFNASWRAHTHTHTHTQRSGRRWQVSLPVLAGVGRCHKKLRQVLAPRMTLWEWTPTCDPRFGNIPKLVRLAFEGTPLFIIQKYLRREDRRLPQDGRTQTTQSVSGCGYDAHKGVRELPETKRRWHWTTPRALRARTERMSPEERGRNGGNVAQKGASA